MEPKGKTKGAVKAAPARTKAKTAPAKTKAKAGPAKTKAKAAPAKPKAAPTKTKAKTGAGRTLVIVESPSKAKTLANILGSRYVIKSSVGHIRDLPRSRMAIDIEHDFAPEYIIVKGKTAIKKELVELSHSAPSVLLASDPDREGEAIAWHLSEILGIPLTKDCRIKFHEITERAVREAVAHPTQIDMRKVSAQQARRILDRLVGYTLSPLLWSKIRYGLSAGRVQSVALTLVCEREKEIEAFVPSEYWNVVVHARGEREPDYELKVNKLDGKPLYKDNLPLLIKDEATADMLLGEVRNNPIIVSDFLTKESMRKPQPPFKTSSMQQDAARRLGMSPRRTMRVAQELYEGLNMPGRGHVGMITYMRTDSLRSAPEAVAQCRALVAEQWGKKYLPAKPNVYAPDERAQDAHEAIRPTDVFITPESVRDALTPEQFRLYDLIWRRFVASQMADAVVAVFTLTADAGRVGMKQIGEAFVFDGWSAAQPLVLKNGSINKTTPGAVLSFVSSEKEQRFTRPPARYSEATLIKTLEEDGIGRPSTYATIVETISDRGYVEKTEDKRLAPTSLGITVDGFLRKYFDSKSLSSIVDVSFTAQMEKELDDIEEDKRQWLDVMHEFWADFSATVEAAKGAEKIPLPPPEPTGENCPECGAPLVKKRGRFGEFIACTGYPQCKYTRAVLEVIGVKCPKCGIGDIAKRKSKKGRTFYGCSRYPECDYVAWSKPTNEKCPECGALMQRKGKSLLCPDCGAKMDVREEDGA
ncbi:MAG: type I DNA topoisomerase [Synergistaceae bacterium]|nr:type I DNA topoisomerase [Synergistaceae bacterium]